METKEINIPLDGPSRLHQLMACPIEIAKQKTRIPAACMAPDAIIHQKKVGLRSSLLISSLGIANIGLFYILLLISS